MTDPEIERLAREVGCFISGHSRNYWAVTDDGLARFAALIEAHERERCAKVCESLPLEVDAFARAEYNASIAACQCAAAIRALNASPPR